MSGISGNSLKDSPDELQLSAWMRKSQAGDKEAYGLLLSKVEKMVRSFTLNSLNRFGMGSPSSADDVVQEVLLALHSKRHTYDPSQYFLPWLYSIARYKLIDHARNYRKLAKHLPIEPETEHLTLLESDDTDPSSQLDVSSILKGLPPRQRELLELVKLEGLSVREAAAKTGLSESNVKVSIHRAIRSLRQHLGGKSNED